MSLPTALQRLGISDPIGLVNQGRHLGLILTRKEASMVRKRIENRDWMRRKRKAWLHRAIEKVREGK